MGRLRLPLTWRRPGRLLAALLASWLAGPLVVAVAPASAQVLRGANNKLPVLLNADQLNYDREKDVITATGNVRISQGDNVVLADTVMYNRRTKIVVATGNVSITRPDGEVVFAKRVVLTDDLKNGVIHQFSLLFPDKTKIAANGAVRVAGKQTEMAKVVMSPCRTCKDDPDAAPLWQIKAAKVIHDEKSKDLIYRDATMEIFGFPVFYTPYFRHPDPTVRRRSGFLIPRFGRDSRLGFFTKIPYFLVLGPDKDITLAPLITSLDRAAMFATYRQRIKNGAFIIDGSYTYTRRRDDEGRKISGNRSRGHLFAKFRYVIDKHWRFAFDGAVTTDDLYLRNYFVTGTDVLTTTPRIEGFYGRNYYSAEAFVFQGLRQEDDFETGPIVAPLLTFSQIGKPVRGWGRWHLDISAVGVQRLDGTDSQRLSSVAGWQLPYTHSMGWRLVVTANVYGDLYLVNGQAKTGDTDYNGFVGRLYPAARIDLRYPFVRELGNVRQIVEPRMALIAMPTGLNSGKIPNDDSLDFELDDANIFSINRFNGRDLVDDGVRLVYGIRTAFYGNIGGKTEIFIGQSIRFKGFQDVTQDASLRSNVSDIVGSILFAPGDYASVLYRFRYDAAASAMRRQELTASVGVPAFRLFTSYVNFASTGDDGTGIFAGREELALAVRSQITKSFSVFGDARWDLSQDGGILRWRMGAQFQNECCTIELSATRSFTRDREVQPNTRILLRIVFKHLGEVGVSR